MNSKSLMMLAGFTALVASVAAVTLHSREAAVKGAGETQKLYPDLLSSVNDVSTVTIKKKDGEYTLQKNGDKWVSVDKKGYPVDVEPVRKTLIGLSEATLIEEKTSDKERYSKLGVQDPDSASATPPAPAPPTPIDPSVPSPTMSAEAAQPTLVTLKDANGKTLASLIVGKAHEGKSFGTNQVYVRKAGESRSWLAKASLDLKDKAVDWLDKKILELKRDRVRAVEVKHPDGEVVHVERQKPEETNFTLANIPEGKELTFATAPNGMSSSLEWLNLEDVVPASEFDFKTGVGPTCTFTTFDGLTITVTTKDENEKTYARFEAAYQAPADAADAKPEDKKDEAAPDAKDKKSEKKKPEEVQKEVADLNARLSPWVFVIPSYNKASFTKHMADLVKDKAPPAPPPGTTPEGQPSDAAGKPLDKDSYKIPDNLPPEIQKQIEADLKAKGHKTEIVPAKPKPPENKPGDATPDDKKPDAEKTSETKPPEDKPKDPPKPPQ